LLAHLEQLAQELAGDHLALAAVVHVGGVKERDSAFHGAPQDRLRTLLVERPFAALVLAVAHHPQADARDAQAGGTEVDVSHRRPPWSRRAAHFELTSRPSAGLAAAWRSGRIEEHFGDVR